MIIGNKTFDTKHHGYIMGILNVTPDSFSDGGMYNDYERATEHLLEQNHLESESFYKSLHAMLPSG